MEEKIISYYHDLKTGRKGFSDPKNYKDVPELALRGNNDK